MDRSSPIRDMDTYLKTALVAATEHALAGEWGRAHEIVQQHEDERLACWVHALVHRVEGDLGNAHYWYGRAGRAGRPERPVADELDEIRATLSAPAAPRR